MKTYILKLKTASTTDYNLYDGSTLVSDADLTTLFATEGEAYFTIDLNSLTPTDLTSLTVVNSSDTAVMTNTGLTLVDGKNFKGEWGNSATSFTSFTQLPAYGLDESQLSTLVEKMGEGKIRGLTVSDNSLDMWDSTTYPDGIYKITKSGGGRTSVYLSNASNGKSVQISGSSYVVLSTDTNYGYRYLVGINNRSGSADYPKGMITALYANSSSSAEKIFDGYTQDNLTTTATDFKYPLSARQGKILNDRIGDLTTLTTTAKTSTVAAINELVTSVGNIETILQTLNSGTGAN